MTYFYEQPDQRLYMVDEHAYGEHYDPEAEHAAWIAISAAFPHVIPVNVITDSFDYDLPKILKEKIMAIGGGKHAALIVNTIQEPVEFSFETKMQHPVFLTYAVGSVASTGTRPEVSVITFTTVTDSAAGGKYFLVNGIDASGEEHFVVWLDEGVTGAPTIAGIAADHILAADVSGAVDKDNPTAAEQSAAVHAIMDADAAFGTVDGTGSVTITNASAGAVRDPRDSGVDPMGITVAITTQGTSTHTVTENTGWELPSFTFHIEQRNTAGGEDIIIDLFGCVISEYELSVDYGDKIVKESVTIKTVNFATGARLTNAPNYVELIDPHTWGDLKESASNYLLQEGTTDKTPDIVNKAVLKISNDIDFQPEIAITYANYAICGNKDVTLQLIGHTKTADTFDYYKDTWDNINQRYSSASGRLNTKFRLERLATHDYMVLSVYNWLIEEHNQHMFSISDRMKGLDITLTEATPNANLRIIDSFSIVDYLSDTCYQNVFT